MEKRRTWKMELSCTERLKSKETARKSKRNVQGWLIKETEQLERNRKG